MKLQPIKTIPVYKDYLWGGTSLARYYHKNNADYNIAESWELSVHPDGMCHVGDQSLKKYIELNPGCLGINSVNKLEIMIKLIDAKAPLSIQVHPDNTYANAIEHDSGKVEMWVVLKCLADSFLYYGLNQAITKNELETKINNNTILDVLNKVKVKQNDIFLIEPGTIHAIGAGIVVCEIQQSSNITYRIYDFDRKDKLGNKRELHIAKALAVCNLQPTIVNTKPQCTLIKNKQIQLDFLRGCPYFNTYQYYVNDSVDLAVGIESFSVIIMIDGTGTVSYDDLKYELQKGETLFIPAQKHQLKVQGKCTFLLVTK